MNDAILRKELAKRVFGNLGMVPPGKVGITAGKDFLYHKQLKIIDEKDNFTYPIYAASLYAGAQPLVVLASKHNNSPDEFSAVFQMSGGFLGVKVLWEDPFGDFMVWQNQWVFAALHEGLGFLAALECATSEGLAWHPAVEKIDDLYDKLIALIDFGEN